MESDPDPEPDPDLYFRIQTTVIMYIFIFPEHATPALVCDSVRLSNARKISPNKKQMIYGFEYDNNTTFSSYYCFSSRAVQRRL